MIPFQTKKYLADVWIVIIRSFFKSNSFDITDITLLKKTRVSSFKRNRKEMKNTFSIFLNTQSIYESKITQNLHGRRLPGLKILYVINFTIKMDMFPNSIPKISMEIVSLQ